MSVVTADPLFLHHHTCTTFKPVQKFQFISKKLQPFNPNCTRTRNRRANICSRHFYIPKALSSSGATVVETSESSNVTFSETFHLKRPEKLEGKITIRLDSGKNEECWKLTVGCSLPENGFFTGVEWDQPPLDMRPSGSIPIKDEESGYWYQHRGRDFKVPLIDYLQDDGNVLSSSSLTAGALGQISNMLHKPEAADSKGDDIRESNLQKRPLQAFYEEHSVFKEIITDNSISVSASHCLERAKNILHIETDLPGDVVIHWGVCIDEGKNWEIPAEPYPPETIRFKNKALRTLLQKRVEAMLIVRAIGKNDLTALDKISGCNLLSSVTSNQRFGWSFADIFQSRKDDGSGSWGSFTLDQRFSAFVFVLKLNENTWLNCNGNDFYIPFTSSVATDEHSSLTHSKGEEHLKEFGSPVSVNITSESNEAVSAHTDGIINEIRNLVSDISSEKSRKTKSREAQESILQEIEKLAAEAYSIFRSSMPTYTDTDVSEDKDLQSSVTISSGTGSGYEILCQGFNWESHKSGKWYMELYEKASELSSLGFTVIWLPPPTDSVSPEGYMPRDLYNLNSRYGNIDQLKSLVSKLHEVGIKVLGDVVLNHRCAQYKNQNGVWNIFGGRLNWDDRAVVADDPHFQELKLATMSVLVLRRGNKSSGDNFHAAPNIDHSQDFVRKDIKEWLRWLRYTYGEMDHNQDAHRQRIVDWINATNGTAGAFDVTTKGILHAALERCEYWRLSDEKGKPPGVVGWWPSRAVTFIENHDTGSTQGHWRFPGGKEMQGYAYILTHPGTPSVFYDHIFSEYQSQILTLISIRKRKKIHCRSTVKIIKAERDVYAAMIDEKLAMKIGPGHYEPSDGAKKWSLAIEGRDYKNEMYVG
ncbi:hypothetical protein DH2020_003401 [Rehmannia glutinosa]|uniref:alpha-amylase n=1 Tax=Rehmannia glutinosa TaxID=99300 RepID=A0ABR0XLG9_REHGL